MEYVIYTNAYKEKLSRSISGVGETPVATYAGFGNGGHNQITAVPIPLTGEETIVTGELVKKPVESIDYEADAKTTIIAILDYDEANNNSISSFGLYDADNELICIKHTSPSPKTSANRIQLIWKEVII